MLGVVVAVAMIWRLALESLVDTTGTMKGLCCTFPKFPGFWSCDILTVFLKKFWMIE